MSSQHGYSSNLSRGNVPLPWLECQRTFSTTIPLLTDIHLPRHVLILRVSLLMQTQQRHCTPDRGVPSGHQLLRPICGVMRRNE